MKTLLILVDGMRPDALRHNARACRMIEKSSYSLCARTVMPSVTLPCHMSLFHSVDPSRHGTTTNTYAPQVRPIRGLCEVLSAAGKQCAMFFNWHELRDLARPGSLRYSSFCKGSVIGWEKANDMVTDATIRCLTSDDLDFAFCYLGYVDEAGHAEGWMGDEYYHALENSWANIDRIMDALPEDYSVIVVADHGEHDRTHGTEMPEDMTIPVIAWGSPFPAGRELGEVSIMDVAPTIARLLGVEPDADWEGKPFC